MLAIFLILLSLAVFMGGIFAFKHAPSRDAAEEAQTARAAVDRGNPVTIVMGDGPAVAVAGARR